MIPLGGAWRPHRECRAPPHCAESEGKPSCRIQSCRKTLDELFSVAYEELRRLAASVRRDDPGATLSPTALVNEAWLKLANSPGVQPASRLHFKRIAARAMRQVLIEAARRRNADKRGGGAAVVTFDDGPAGGATPARTSCWRSTPRSRSWPGSNPRQAQMVESRFFGGLDVSETAELLEVSEATDAARLARGQGLAGP